MNLNYNRRTFLQQTLLGSLGVITANSFLHAADETSKLKQIGLIVGVLGKEMRTDWEGTLRKVAKMGYTHLEFNKYYGESAASFKRFMKEVGLTPLAGGLSISEMKKEDLLKKAADEALVLGKKYMVCYWPWPDSGNDKKLDDFKKAADELNYVGEQCNKMGIRFAMHNHDKEFVPVQGYKWGYEVLLKETDPAKVAMQLDLYWVTKGGGDPIQLLKDYPERFELFHVKDMDKTSKQSFTCPGYGIIDFKKIFAQAKKSNVKYYVVEIDRAEQPMTCVQDSITYLKKLRY